MRCGFSAETQEPEDNHWNGQKSTVEKSGVGNELYTEEATVLGGLFVFFS